MPCASSFPVHPVAREVLQGQIGDGMSRIQPVPAKVKLGQQVPDEDDTAIAPHQICRQRSSWIVTP